MLYSCHDLLKPSRNTLTRSHGWWWCHLLQDHILAGVQEGQLFHHGLFGDEVEHLGYVPVLDNGHTPHRALVSGPVLDDGVVTAAGATQLSQAVKVGQVGHDEAFYLVLQDIRQRRLYIQRAQKWFSRPTVGSLSLRAAEPQVAD